MMRFFRRLLLTFARMAPSHSWSPLSCLELGRVTLPQPAPWTLVMGIPGSGKTRLIFDLARQVLPDGHGRLGCRALLYDKKLEWLPMLDALGIPRSLIHVIDPLDQDGEAWNLAADCDRPLLAQQIATLLFPTQDDKGNTFFPKAARDLGAGVIDVLARLCPGRWTLNDVFTAMGSADILERLLPLTHDGQIALGRAFHRDELAGDIMAEAGTKLAPFQSVARLCERSKNPPFSLKAWFEAPEPSIIVLRAHSEASVAIDALNRVFLQRFVQLFGSQPQTHDPSRRTWVALDEFRFGGFRGEDLTELVMFCRGAGAFGVLALQDLAGLKDAFGEHKANELLAAAGNHVYLALSHPETARWAAERLGQFEAWVESVSVATGFSAGTAFPQTTKTRSWSLQQRPVVLPQQLMTMAPAGPFAVPGYFVVPGLPPWHEIAVPQVPLVPAQPPFVPRPPEQEDPIPFDQTRVAELLSQPRMTLRSLQGP